jgi:hypothetical protein
MREEITPLPKASQPASLPVATQRARLVKAEADLDATIDNLIMLVDSVLRYASAGSDRRRLAG